MQTVTLKINDQVSEKFLWLLNHFSPSEIEILDKNTYESDDDYLRHIKGMEQSILQAAKEPTENYVTSGQLDW